MKGNHELIVKLGDQQLQEDEIQEIYEIKQQMELRINYMMHHPQGIVGMIYHLDKNQFESQRESKNLYQNLSGREALISRHSNESEAMDTSMGVNK